MGNLVPTLLLLYSFPLIVILVSSAVSNCYERGLGGESKGDGNMFSNLYRLVSVAAKVDSGPATPGCVSGNVVPPCTDVEPQGRSFVLAVRYHIFSLISTLPPSPYSPALPPPSSIISFPLFSSVPLFPLTPLSSHSPLPSLILSHSHIDQTGDPDSPFCASTSSPQYCATGIHDKRYNPDEVDVAGHNVDVSLGMMEGEGEGNGRRERG